MIYVKKHIRQGWDWLGAHNAEIRLSVRVTAAGLAAFLLSHLLELPQGYWAVLTAVLIIQSSIGGSLKAALERLIGTFGGAVYGALIASLVPHENLTMMAVTLAIGLAPPALLAALKPSFRIAPVTVIIVLFSSTVAGPHVSVIQYAFDRVIEIGIGSIIGLFVALTILPARAHSQVAESSAKVLNQMAGLLPLLLSGMMSEPDRAAILAQQDKIRKALSKLESLGDEAIRERASHLAMGPDPEPLLRTLRRMRHDLVMLSRATSQTLPDTLTPRLGPPVAAVTEASATFLRNAATALEQRKAITDSSSHDGAFEFYTGQILALRQEKKFRDLSTDMVGRIYALGFALEQLRLNFRDLNDRVTDFEVKHLRNSKRKKEESKSL